LYGPPGLGKTTLAAIIAQELEVDFEQTSGPILQKKLDLTGILSNVRLRQVFFIDEIHRLLPDVEEMLYSALEDFRVDILIGAGCETTRKGGPMGVSRAKWPTRRSICSKWTASGWTRSIKRSCSRCSRITAAARWA